METGTSTKGGTATDVNAMLADVKFFAKGTKSRIKKIKKLINDIKKYKKMPHTEIVINFCEVEISILTDEIKKLNFC